jgi:tRNA modification GTPase
VTGNAIRVVTRCDLLAEWPEDVSDVHYVSGKTGRGVQELMRAIGELAGEISEPALASFNERQSGCIARALEALDAARTATQSRQPFDIIAAELYRSIGALSAVYEQADHNAVIETVFSSFCVGK